MLPIPDVSQASDRRIPLVDPLPNTISNSASDSTSKGLSNSASASFISRFFNRPSVKSGRFVVKLCLLFFLLTVSSVVLYVAFGISWSDPYAVTVSNVTDRSATISWVTREPVRGVVAYSESPNFLPGILTRFGKNVAFDDRDIIHAQEQTVAKIAENAQNAGSDIVSYEEIAEDITLSELSSFYVHHVTIKNLDPDSTYFFRVGNGNRFTFAKDGSSDFSTKAELDNLLVPNPAYGLVKFWGDEDNPVDDGIAYLQLSDGVETSDLASAVLGENGSWYIDVNSIRSINGDLFLYDREGRDIREILTIEASIQGRYEVEIDPDNDAPAPVVIIQDPEMEENQPNVKQLSPSVSFVNKSFSFLQEALAFDCSENRGFPCSKCKGCHEGCNYDASGNVTGCGYMDYCSSGCERLQDPPGCECGCPSGTKSCTGTGIKCENQKCVSSTPPPAQEPSNPNQGSCIGSTNAPPVANGFCGPDRSGCYRDDGSGDSSCAWRACNNGSWVKSNDCCGKCSASTSERGSDNPSEEKTCESEGLFTFDVSSQFCGSPHLIIPIGNEVCCSTKPVERSNNSDGESEEESEEESGEPTSFLSVCSANRNEYNDANCNNACSPSQCFKKTETNYTSDGGSVTRHCYICLENYYNKSNCDNACGDNATCIFVGEGMYRCQEGLYDTRDCNGKCPGFCKEYSEGFYYCETSQMASADIEAIPGVPVSNTERVSSLYNQSNTSSRKLINTIIPPVIAQEPTSSSLILSPTEGLYLFDNSGVYCSTIQTVQYCFDVSTPGKKILYIDSNLNSAFDGEDYDLGEFYGEIEVELSESTNIYKVKNGYSILAFNLASTDPEQMMASSVLKKLNVDHNDAFFSIAMFEDGRWIVVGNRDGEQYGGNDFMIIPGKGYLVKAKQSLEFVISGRKVVSPVPVSLVTGWNLVAVHGTEKGYTASSLIDSIDSVEGLDANNVTMWDLSTSRYKGLQKEKDAGGNMEVYGFDFPLDPLSGYFVRIASGSGVWEPEE